MTLICFLDSQGEFNSGKSTVINALLGERYLKDGVVPTTNEITFLRYSELDGEDLQRCERHPDGQLVCYLPAPILKEVSPFLFSSFCTPEFNFRVPLAMSMVCFSLRVDCNSCIYACIGLQAY